MQNEAILGILLQTRIRELARLHTIENYNRPTAQDFMVIENAMLKAMNEVLKMRKHIY